MRKLLIWLLVALLTTGCGDDLSVSDQIALIEVEPNETERLNEWFDAKYTEEMRFFVWRKAMYGIKDEDYGRIDDLSEQGLDEALKWRQNATQEMRTSFSYEALSPEGKESWDLWEYMTERAVAARQFRSSDLVFKQTSFGLQRLLPLLIIAWHQVDEVRDAEDYVNRIAESGRALEQLVARARLYADQGIHPPYFVYDIVSKEAEVQVNGQPFENSEQVSPIWADFNHEVDALQERGELDDGRANQLRKSAKEALLASWGPANKSLIDWLALDRRNAPKITTGVGRLPSGSGFYRERLAFHTTTNISPEEIHQIGLQNVARLQKEIEDVKIRTNFKGSLSQFFTLLRDSKDDRRFYFPDTEAGRKAYLDESTSLLSNIESKLPDYFGLLPKADLVVRRVESFREQPGAAQHYNPSSPDGSRPGVYYAHLIDMTSMPKFELEAIAYHEGLPGHHMQFAIANELVGVPEFRKRSYVVAFNEGWGLYAEGLAKEFPGTYRDPYSEVGRLNSEIWRAIRLVVDTGLHAKGWTEQQAVEYFLANSMTTEGQARSEVRRYIVNPGQATAYMIGMLKIRELRERAASELGKRFNIQAFHDVVLGSGPLPLGLLERKVDNWIRSF